MYFSYSAVRVDILCKILVFNIDEFTEALDFAVRI
jgi:hypothetical protein